MTRTVPAYQKVAREVDIDGNEVVACAAHLGSAGTNYLVSRLHQRAVFGDIDPDVWNQAVEAATRCERRAASRNREVTTVEELEALSVGTKVMTVHGEIWERHSRGWGWDDASGDSYPSSFVATRSGLTIVWQPS